MVLELDQARQPVEIGEEAIAEALPASTHHSQPAMGRRVIILAWPVIAQNLLETLVGIIDTLLVARLGAAAIAGVGTSLQIMFFLLGILSAVTIGASIMVAHAIGAADWPGARRVAKQAISWGILGAIPLAAAGTYWAAELTSIFRVAPDVAVIGTDYLRITMLSFPALLLVFVTGAILRGAGDTRTPLLVGLLSNVINAVLAWGLIYGHLALPALGAVGSAWAAALGRITAAAILLLVLIRGKGKIALRGRSEWWPHFASVQRVLALGVPAAIEQVFVSIAFSVLTIVIATLGTLNLAAQRISFNALSVAFLPGIGFSVAVSTLVGQSLGAGNPAEARAAARAGAVWVTAWMTAMALGYFFFAPHIMRWFTADAEVIDLGAQSLRVLAFSQPLWGLLFVWAGALRGAGNTREPLILNVLGMWLGVGASFILVSAFPVSLPLIWAACLPGWALNALGNWLCFRRDNLTKLSRHQAPSPEALAVA